MGLSLVHHNNDTLEGTKPEEYTGSVHRGPVQPGLSPACRDFCSFSPRTVSRTNLEHPPPSPPSLCPSTSITRRFFLSLFLLSSSLAAAIDASTFVLLVSARFHPYGRSDWIPQTTVAAAWRRAPCPFCPNFTKITNCEISAPTITNILVSLPSPARLTDVVRFQ